MLIAEKQHSSSKVGLVLDGGPLSLSRVVQMATAECRVSLSEKDEVRERVAAAVALVEQAVAEGQPVYGVTTGFGGMADVPVPCELAAASQDNLLSFLATAAGRPIELRHVRAAMGLRANVLLRGHSGVRFEIIERLVHFLNCNATPIVRELGSIGASGDLVPLSAVARAISGHSNCVRVDVGGREVDGLTALRELGLAPLSLRPKEGLAIVNGTSFSAAIAANCVHEARILMVASLCTQAMMLQALEVQVEPFDEFVQACKPHPGQIWTAKIIKRLLNEGREGLNGSQNRGVHAGPKQDRYSLRCLPQYMAPIVEGLVRIEEAVATEMNAVSDNPLIDAESGRFYQSGNFLGQYLGVAMDDLRRFLGLTAKHLDVQIASLVSPPFNRGLPSSLRGNERLAYNMGLKGLQITGNSIMPLLTYLGNPLVEHFPTHAEQFNQNINGLSWGSANMAWKSVELFQQYLAVALIFSIQALDLRAKRTCGHYDGRALLGTLSAPLYAAACRAMSHSPGADKPFLFDDSDQWLEEQMAALVEEIRNHGPVVESLAPVMESFDKFPLQS